MKEIQQIVDNYEKYADDQECALATVVHVEGSSYRRIGARMLVFQNGNWVGGISGGCLEGDALRKAKLVMHNKRSKIVRYDTREESYSSIGIGLGCNGVIDVLISAIETNDKNNAISLLKECTTTRSEHILITTLNESSDNFGELMTLDTFRQSHSNEENLLVKLNNRIALAQKRQSSQILEFEEKQLLIEYLPPAIRVLVFGAQYDTIPCLKLFRLLGWQSVLICNKQKSRGAIKELADLLIDVEETKKTPKSDNHTVALLMSHDYATDKNNLLNCLNEEQLKYIGILGPRKRTNKMLKELSISAEHQKRIFSPIGLDTGAGSPKEIAVAIAAEIRTYFSGRKGGHLRERILPINDRNHLFEK